MTQQTRDWLAGFARHFDLPGDYLVFDIETSGGSAEEDVVTQVGYVVVQGGHAVDSFEFVLGWPGSGLVDELQLRRRLEDTLWRSQQHGRVLPMSWERMQLEGVPPLDGLNDLFSLLESCQKSLVPLVAHGGYRFDCRMLLGADQRFARRGFQFSDNELYDTGSIERGSQTMAPLRPGETLAACCRRLLGGKQKAYWNLHEHCASKYDLTARLPAPAAQSHNAGYDALLTHFLFEQFRDMAGVSQSAAALRSAQELATP